MEPIREITEDATSELGSEYSTYNSQTTELVDSIHQLREEVRAEVLARQFQEEVAAGFCSARCSSRRCLKAAFFTVVISLVWMALSVPTVIYIVNVVERRAGENSENTYVTNDSNSTCMTQEYTGTACRRVLANIQRCQYGIDYRDITGDDEDVDSSHAIYVAARELDSENHEAMAGIIQSILSSMPVPEECKERLPSFVCMYLFPLDSCGRDGEGQALRPSREECVYLREHACQQLWEMVGRMDKYKDKLPNCELLPESYNASVLETCADNITSIDTQLNCSESENFRLSATNPPQCFPVCQEWSPYSALAVQVTDVLTMLAASVALLSGCAVVVLGCVRFKRIFSYSSIFVIYQTIPPVVLATLVIIGFIARPRLFCTSENLRISVLRPSTYCKITGIAFHYFLLQLLLWWLCHITAVFQGTLFPLHTKGLQSRKKLKYIHVTMFILGWVLPVGPTAIIAHTGITLTRSPIILCTGHNANAIFGAMVVPISIVIASGATMLVFILWTVIKRHIQARKNRLRVNLNWTAEAKVLAILVYFIVLGAVVLTILTNSLTAAEEYFKVTEAYFTCKASGTIDAELDSLEDERIRTSCDRENFEELVNPIPTAIAFILLGLYPTINLVYIINIRELRRKLMCKEERKVQMMHISSNNRVRSTLYRPMVVGGSNTGIQAGSAGRGNGNNNKNVVTSSFSNSLMYVRPSTFKPLPPTPVNYETPVPSPSPSPRPRPPTPPPRTAVPVNN